MQTSQPGEGNGRLEEVHGKPEGKVCDQKPPVSIALPTDGSAQTNDQCNQEQRFIELRRVAVNAVSEVDAPGQTGCDAISMVGEAVEKAPYAADRNSHRDWNREKISGPA